MTEQGSPPRRPGRQPDLGRRGYNRDPYEDGRPSTDGHSTDGHSTDGHSAERPGGERPGAERHSAERPRLDRQRPDRQRPDRPRRPERPGDWEQFNTFGPDTDTDLPPWAGPSIHAARPGGTRLRPPARVEEYERTEHADPWEGDEPPAWPDEVPAPASTERAQRPGGRRAGRRAAAARLRKSRRRVLNRSAIAIVACVLAAVVVLIVTHKTTPKLPYVTALQPGEFESVPDACTAVSPATLAQYVPSAGRTTVQSENSSTQSECTFTVDSKPTFLVLSLQVQSYQPFAAASGDGSASQNALDNFTAARALLKAPLKGSPLPAATISALTGVGQRAFLAVQLEHLGGAARDVATVTTLYRNVVVTVSVSAQESGGYGPVSPGTLGVDAQAVATAALTKAKTQPTA